MAGVPCKSVAGPRFDRSDGRCPVAHADRGWYYRPRSGAINPVVGGDERWYTLSDIRVSSRVRATQEAVYNSLSVT